MELNFITILSAAPTLLSVVAFGLMLFRNPKMGIKKVGIHIASILISLSVGLVVSTQGPCLSVDPAQCVEVFEAPTSQDLLREAQLSGRMAPLTQAQQEQLDRAFAFFRMASQFAQLSDQVFAQEQRKTQQVLQVSSQETRDQLLVQLETCATSLHGCSVEQLHIYRWEALNQAARWQMETFASLDPSLRQDALITLMAIEKAKMAGTSPESGFAVQISLFESFRKGIIGPEVIRQNTIDFAAINGLEPSEVTIPTDNIGLMQELRDRIMPGVSTEFFIFAIADSGAHNGAIENDFLNPGSLDTSDRVKKTFSLQNYLEAVAENIFSDRESEYFDELTEEQQLVQLSVWYQEIMAENGELFAIEMIVLSDNINAVDNNRPYDGWESFFKDKVQDWESVTGVGWADFEKWSD